jgi:hypothetical protein
MTCHNFDVELPQKGRFYGLFLKPVKFGTKNSKVITDGLARFHASGGT